MPRVVDPDRVLDKYAKLHTRIVGFDRPVTFVKFENTTTTFFESPTTSTNVTEVDPQPIVKDRPGDELADTFPGGLAADQRIFIFLADSFVVRTPTDTLAERAEEFILQRAGQNAGGILYGSKLYVIEQFYSEIILGGVTTRYIILAKSQKAPGD